MITKYKYEKLLKIYLEPLKKALHLNKQVNVHIYNSQSKKYKELMPRSSHKRSTHEYGYTFINDEGAADVLLFYDCQSNEREALATLIHELLHIRVAAISGLVTIKNESMYRKEEYLVRHLEELIISLLWDNKL